MRTFGNIDERFDESRASDSSETRKKAEAILGDDLYKEKVGIDKQMREIFSRLYRQFISEIILEAQNKPDPEDFEKTINHYSITLKRNSQGRGYREVSDNEDLYKLYDFELEVGKTEKGFFEAIYVKGGLLERDILTTMGEAVDVAMLRAKIYLHRRIYKMQSRFNDRNELEGNKIITADESFALYKYTHHEKWWQLTFQDAVDSIKKAFDLLSGCGTYGREHAFDYYEDLIQTRLLSILSALAPIGEIVPRGGRGYFFVNPFNKDRLPELTMSEEVKSYLLGKKQYILQNVISQGDAMAQGHMTGLGCPVRNTGQIEEISRAMLSLARRFYAAGGMDNVYDKRT